MGRGPGPGEVREARRKEAVSALAGDCPMATMDRNASGDLCWGQAGGGSRKPVAKMGPLIPEV